MSDEPTTGEIVRRLDALTAQIAELVSELKQDRADAAKTYVRQDVYIAEKRADRAVVSDLQSDIAALRTDTDREFRGLKQENKDQAAARRQIWLALGGTAIAALIALASLIVNVIQG